MTRVTVLNGCIPAEREVRLSSETPIEVGEDLHTYHRALDVAQIAYRAMVCRGAARCDFRYDNIARELGRLVLLETNTRSGSTPTSPLPDQAVHRCMNLAQLCTWTAENVSCRA